MSRKMIETNAKLFEKLKAVVRRDVPEYEAHLDGRWCIWTDDEEMKLLQHAKVSVLTALPGKLVIGISHENQRFVALPERDDRTSGPPFMKGVLAGRLEDHAGLYTLIWGETSFPVRDRPGMGYELIDRVFGLEMPTGTGFAPADLRDFFADVSLYQLDPNNYDEINDTSLLRLYGGFLANHPSLLSLRFTPDTLEAIKALLEDFPGPIIGQAIFRGLTASHWEHAFLEFYRCVERLYRIPYVEELKGTLSATHRGSEVADRLYDVLKWSPRGDEALGKLLSVLRDKPLYNALHTILPALLKEGTQVESGLYKLRNRIAHWSTSLGPASEQDEKWDDLIRALCELITELYTTWKDAFVPPPGELMGISAPG